jgi:ribosomal protein S18 acetylase RimI-like enzyme
MPPMLQAADAADIPAIVKLMNAAYRGTGPDAGWNSEADFIEGDRTSEAGLRQELASTPESTLLVSRENASSPIQGCVSLEPISAQTWYLGSLTVDPSLQNSGLGRKLLSAAEQYAIERGARTIQMKVVNVRDTVIAWYQRRGYRLTGETIPFPYASNRFGTPLRTDLSFVVLEKTVQKPL